MPFLTRGKTNWKYILVVLILAVIVGGGILVWIKKQEIPPAEFPEIEIEKLEEEVKVPIEKVGETLIIYPYEAKDIYGADVPYCISKGGAKYSATGVSSANWFVWGGCAYSKVYKVIQGKELVFHVYTDSNPDCICCYPEFYVYEYRNKKWEEVKHFNYPPMRGFAENVFYTPSSDRIKISSNLCFYLDVYLGKIEDIERIIAGKIEAQRSLPEKIIDEFMNARLNMNKEQALIYLTENAREQFLRPDSQLTLINPNFSSFEISQIQSINQAKFRAIVNIKVKGQPTYTVEIMDVITILGDFFIDSVELAG